MKCQADPVGHNCCKILNAFQAPAQAKSHHQTFFKTLMASTAGSTLQKYCQAKVKSSHEKVKEKSQEKEKKDLTLLTVFSSLHHPPTPH